MGKKDEEVVKWVLHCDLNWQVLCRVLVLDIKYLKQRKAHLYSEVLCQKRRTKGSKGYSSNCLYGMLRRCNSLCWGLIEAVSAYGRDGVMYARLQLHSPFICFIHQVVLSHHLLHPIWKFCLACVFLHVDVLLRKETHIIKTLLVTYSIKSFSLKCRSD